MTNQNERIALAEFMGWKCTSKTTYPTGAVHKSMWRDPIHGTAGNTVCDLPDPRNNDTDCMALVDALNKAGHVVRVAFYKNGCDVQVGDWRYEGGVSSEGRDYYRDGVCELAMKVID